MFTHSVDDHFPLEDLQEMLWFLVLDHTHLNRCTSILVIQCHSVQGGSSSLILQ